MNSNPYSITSIQSNLTNDQYRLLIQFQQFISKPLYFYGSITRLDYIKGKSDIDVDIFSNDLHGTKLKCCQFFNIDPTIFHSAVLMTSSKQLIHGLKAKIKHNCIELECCIYSIHDKKQVLIEHHKYFSPILLILFLFIKQFKYHWNILPTSIYIYFKRLFMNDGDVRFSLIN